MASATRSPARRWSPWPCGRVKLDGPEEENILNFIDPKKYALLPNTAAPTTAEDALRIARLAKEQGMK